MIDIEKAYERIHSYLHQTPLLYAPTLSKLCEAEIYFKPENWQLSGSFKIRGALNKILSIPKDQWQGNRFVAVSTGNHAAAFAQACQLFNIEGLIFLPKTISPAKLNFISSFGIEYRLHGQDSLETELYAGAYAKEHGHILVHPYNDETIIEGQGTIGLEIYRDLPDVNAVFVSVGGGGLISGIGHYLKNKNPDIQVIGCQPSQSPEMHESLRRGEIVKESITKPTLSDGTAGGLEPDAITFELVKKYVDDLLLIEEAEIAKGIRFLIEHQQMIVEGSGALPVASVQQMKEQVKGKKVVLVLCGRRLSFEKLVGLIGTP